MDIPVRVYLDNQDLSRLYNPRTQEFRDVADSLLDFEQSGVATFHYSYWHIFEFLQPADPRFMADRRERVRFLKRLCGSNALPYFSDITNGRKTLSGVWFPVELLDSLTLDINKSLVEALAKRTLNRSARRKARNESFRRQAFATTFPGNTFERRTQFQFSLTPSFVAEGTFSKFVRGEITDRAFGESFAQMFCDPEFFFQKWFVEGHRESVINDQVAAIGLKWAEVVEDVRTKLLDYQRLRKVAVKGRRDFYSKLREADLPPAVKQSLSERMPKPMPPMTVSDVLAMGKITDPRLKYLECYMHHYVAAEHTQTSDIADLMHLFYAQDMDLLRCDKAIHNIMKDCPHLPQSRIINDLKQLPAAIEDVAAARVS